MTATIKQLASPLAAIVKPSEIKLRSNIRQDAKADEGLVASVKAQGIIEPLVVTLDNFLLAGHRRLDAAKRAGLVTIPVYYRKVKSLDLSDQQFSDLQFAENTHRKDLTLLEKTKAVREHFPNQEELAKELGQATPSEAFQTKVRTAAAALSLTPKVVYVMLRIIQLPKKFWDWLNKGVLFYEHAAAFVEGPQAKWPIMLERLGYHVDTLVTSGLGGSVPVQEVMRLVEDNTNKDLTKVPWDLKQPLAGKPACLGCVYNSGCQETLFGKEPTAGDCRNAKCYYTKRSAWNSGIRGKAVGANIRLKRLPFVGFVITRRDWGTNKTFDEHQKGWKSVPLSSAKGEAKEHYEKGYDKGKKPKYGWALFRNQDGFALPKVYLVTIGQAKTKEDREAEVAPSPEKLRAQAEERFEKDAKHTVLLKALMEHIDKMPDSAVLPLIELVSFGLSKGEKPTIRGALKCFVYSEVYHSYRDDELGKLAKAYKLKADEAKVQAEVKAKLEKYDAEAAANAAENKASDEDEEDME